MKGNILTICRTKPKEIPRYEFIIHVRQPVVITSFYTYHTRGGAMKAAKREAKKLGIQIY
jgi:hypothetical protein